MGMHVLAVGNTAEGIRLIGPFKTIYHAIEYAEHHVVDTWVALPLEAVEK